MSVEKILKATNIPLTKDVNLEEAGKLLKYLAKELPADINYIQSGYIYLTRSPFNCNILHETKEGHQN
ncbi:MAG TPA: hypothetical protein ENG87_04840 [Candidatus Pacearchaeota archaeon]|nr:hypothetical protein BMS3Abin17_00869 [archaeon BMS3Abin17]HDK42684.1 hypothetical protein [Candidatus Pacearchaeota archaeon]HDZ61352.1 hypothetical protein [Candidatus Pacearchaeota archaeon]